MVGFFFFFLYYSLYNTLLTFFTTFTLHLETTCCSSFPRTQ